MRKTIFFIVAIACLLNGCVKDMWFKKNQAVAQRGIAGEEATIPHNITIMLPLKGKGELALTSQAIRNGILAAYYSGKNREDINLKVVDITGGDINVFYQQAVADGAEVIIGPLTKDKVQSLVKGSRLTVPTIALNTLDEYKYGLPENLYQFGLLPQDEAVQVAVKMAQQHLHNVAVIVPEGPWGSNIATAFINKYVSLGGRVPAVLSYRFGKNLAEQICHFLAYDASKLCVPRTRESKKQKDPEEIMRRQDIDAIFFVATKAAQARQIVPLLKFYYAGDLPSYSISTVYTGVAKPQLDQDINDVYFCDMPWVVEGPDSFSPELLAVYQQIMETTLWANSFANYSKFYALGIDAYNLAVKLDNLSAAIGFVGASGVLYLDNFHHIYRKLQWAQIQNGVVKKVPNLADIHS